MASLGWTRVDPRPWSKLRARWEHTSGWRLDHCGHPTALWPWALFDPAGQMVCTGVAFGNPRSYGTAWPDLRMVTAWLDAWLKRQPAGAVPA